MEDSGQKLDINLSLKEDFEVLADVGRLSMNALMQLTWENELTLTRAEKRSIFCAQAAINRIRQRMCK